MKGLLHRLDLMLVPGVLPEHLKRTVSQAYIVIEAAKKCAERGSEFDRRELIALNNQEDLK